MLRFSEDKLEEEKSRKKYTEIRKYVRIDWK